MERSAAGQQGARRQADHRARGKQVPQRLQGELAGIALSVALLIYTFWPENVFASQREKTRLDFLLERKEQLYENLRDLNFEYKAGKYPEEDFLVQRTQLENEAALLLAEIENLQQA